MLLKSIKGLLAVFLISINIFSQEGDNCGYYKYQVAEALKAGDFNLACSMWQMGYKLCNDYSTSFLTNGRTAYSKKLYEKKRQFENWENESKVQILVDTLDWIYTERMKMNEDSRWTEKYATFLAKYRTDEVDKIIQLFAQSIEELKTEARPTSYYTYLKYFIIRSRSEEKPSHEMKRAVHNLYLDLTGWCLKAAANQDDPDSREKYLAADQKLDIYSGRYSETCSDLDTSLKIKLAALDNIPELRSEILKRMTRKFEDHDCKYKAGYLDILLQIIEIEHSFQAYMSVIKLYYATEKYDLAAEYSQKARNSTKTKAESDEWHYHRGIILMAQKKYVSAFHALNTVQGPFQKDAYDLMAQAIASMKCGESTFERKSVFWLANAFINKAIAAGKTGLNSKMYLDQIPSPEDGFSQTPAVHEGDSVRITCLGLSTIARY
jgi:hypothetical protein